MDEKNKDKTKISFLIVDRFSTKRSNLIRILTDLGFARFEQVNDGVEAFRLLKRRPVDCIISALDMPQMNGISLLKVVSADERLFEIPFFIIAASINKEIVLEAGKCGVTAILLEPLDEIVFEKRINEVLIAGEEDAKTIKVEDMFIQSEKLIQEGNYEDALEICKNILKEYEDAEVYYNIGYIKSSQGKYDEAIIAFRKAVKINKLHAKAYKMMGEVYIKKGDTQEAERCLEKAGEIFLERNMDKEAEGAFKEVLKLNPNTVNIYNSLGIVYRRRNNFKEAIHQYQLALKVDPKDENIYFNLGRAFLEDKQILEAKKSFEKALLLNPDLTAAQQMLKAIELGFKH